MPSNVEVVEALQEGFVEAEWMLRGLNLAPTVHAAASRKVWFNKLWLIEKVDPKFMVYTPPARPVCGEDGNSEVLRDAVARSSSNAKGTIAPSTLNLDVGDEILDEVWILKLSWKTRLGMPFPTS